MALEMANTINQLVESNPLGTDNKSQGDDHIRLIKKTLRNTFPNITGPITVSEAAINGLGTGKNLTFPGMIVMWSGATVPSGWLLCDGTGKLSNGQAVPDLRGRFIVGAGVGTYIGDTGGTSSHSHTVSVAGHTLTIDQIPSHTHSLNVMRYSDYSYEGLGGEGNGGGIGSPWGYNPVQPTGGGEAHSHGANTGSINHLPPYYALAFIIKE